ncbi:MAG TPA: histidine kinase, partial [Anaerolineae bacterium]|nr:histidine kinase [Anaerolineae bacterium]
LQENFIATVSHDLRSPLGFIKGYATTLLREDTKWDSSIRREFLTIIDEEADRLGELIDNLLDSSRLQAGTLSIDLQQLRIDTLLRDIIQRAIAGTYKLNIIPQTNFPKVLINGDSRRLVQVFDNLFRNADKYASGSLIKISMDTTSERVLITFQDFGPGIPEEHLEDIFKRFYRLPHHSNAGRGSGLGLYICRKIIRAHGGEIYAKSKIGQGTAFFIDLPRVKNIDGYEENEK